MKCSFR